MLQTEAGGDAEDRLLGRGNVKHGVRDLELREEAPDARLEEDPQRGGPWQLLLLGSSSEALGPQRLPHRVGPKVEQRFGSNHCIVTVSKWDPHEVLSQ